MQFAYLLIKNIFIAYYLEIPLLFPYNWINKEGIRFEFW
jgi:hypothetical protein